MGSSGIQSVKIARAVLADGQALVGLSLSPEDVPNVKQRLGIGTPLGEASPNEILGLLAGGSIIELDNGRRLTTARIAGDGVLELVLNGVPANREELLGYGLSEEIIYYKRRWFVVRDDAGDMLRRLLMHRKPVKDLTARGHGTTFAIELFASSRDSGFWSAQPSSPPEWRSDWKTIGSVSLTLADRPLAWRALAVGGALGLLTFL